MGIGAGDQIADRLAVIALILDVVGHRRAHCEPAQKCGGSVEHRLGLSLGLLKRKNLLPVCLRRIVGPAQGAHLVLAIFVPAQDPSAWNTGVSETPVIETTVSGTAVFG